MSRRLRRRPTCPHETESRVAVILVSGPDAVDPEGMGIVRTLALARSFVDKMSATADEVRR